jgi:hypothetical protein
MSDFSLKGTNGSEITVRKLKDKDINDREVFNLLEEPQNPNDEIILKDDKGDKYIILSDNLTYHDGKDSLLYVHGQSNPNVSFVSDPMDEDAPGSWVSDKSYGSGPGTIAGMAREADFQRRLNQISEPVSDEVKNKILKDIK